MRADREDAFVMDNSVVMSWVDKDEQDSYSIDVLKATRSHKVIVPPLWQWEVTNALITGIKKKRITAEEAQQFLTYLKRMAIEVSASRSMGELTTLFKLACEQKLTAYDAEYLLLAWELELPLATLDDDLLDAITRIGIKRF